MEQHDFLMEIIDADGNGGTLSTYSLLHRGGGGRVRVRHRVRRLVEPELPDDSLDDGSAVVEDWVELDLDEWSDEQ